MTQVANRTPDVEDVLYQFVLNHPRPDADALETYARLYPEYAEALTELAIDLAVEGILENAEGPASTWDQVDDASVERAISHFQNGLFARDQEIRPPSARTPVKDPFAGMDRTSFRHAAQTLNANSVFLMKLRDRRIRPETISAGFIAAAARALNAANDDFAEYLGAPQAMASGRRYKSDEKPVAGEKESFEEAVRGSGLTPEQQTYLLGL